jgi:hypothetical protein
MTDFGQTRLLAYDPASTVVNRLRSIQKPQTIINHIA